MKSWTFERAHYYRNAAGTVVVMVLVFRKEDGRKVSLPFMYFKGELVSGLGGGWHVPGKKLDLECWVPIDGATDPNVPPPEVGATLIPKWKRVLYGLPELLKAIAAKPNSGYVFICEGEKDVDTLASLGLLATTNLGGAGAFTEEDVALFKDEHVVLLEDNDEAGRKRVQHVSRLLNGIAASIRVVTFRDMPEHGDVTDWLDAQKGVQDDDKRRLLLERVDAAHEWHRDEFDANPFDDEEDDSGQRPAFPAGIFRLLPTTWRAMIALLSTWYERDVFLTGLLGVLSAALPNYRFSYGKAPVEHFANLYFFVLAKAASGKGVLRHAFRLIEPIDELLLEESKATWEKWAEDMKAGRDAGPEPAEECLIIGEDPTDAALRTRLQHNRHGSFMGGTEADALGTANKKNHGQFSHMLRRAFHHEPIRVDRLTQPSIRILNARLSLVLSGTLDQFIGVIHDIRNGLFSRFAVLHFEAPLVYTSQRPSARSLELNRATQEAGQQALRLFKLLRARERPLYFEVSEALWAKVDAPVGDLFDRLFEEHHVSPELAATVYRGAIIIFRIAMIISVWRYFEEDADLVSMDRIQAREADIEAAVGLGLVYIEHAIRQALQEAPKLGLLPDMEDVGALQRMHGDQRRFLDALPMTFETAGAHEVRNDLGISYKTMFRWLDQFVSAGLLIKEGHGRYRKNDLDDTDTIDTIDLDASQEGGAPAENVGDDAANNTPEPAPEIEEGSGVNSVDSVNDVAASNRPLADEARNVEMPEDLDGWEEF